MIVRPKPSAPNLSILPTLEAPTDRIYALNAMVDLLSIEANNEQHDAVLDYYGRRLATCSSDKTIKIFEVEGESHRLVETLKG
jgi:hypothetical protein